MSFITQIENVNNLGFFSRILMYHQIALEKMFQIKNDKGKNLSLNKLNELITSMNWRLDRDIQTIQFSETGIKFFLLLNSSYQITKLLYLCNPGNN